MEFHLLLIFAFLCLAVVVSHAFLPSEVYWQTALPNTPMPKSIRVLLRPAGKSTSIDFRNEDLAYTFKYSRKEDPGYTFKYSSKEEGPSYGMLYKDEDFRSASPEGQLQDDLSVTKFFLEKDLHPGKKMKLHFTRVNNGASTIFLPREVADSMPFSSNKLPEILNRFAMKDKSIEAEILKKTIELCEEPGNEKEDRYCAKSLESLIDFSTLELGKRVQVLSTEVKTGTQDYKIGGGVKMVGEKTVACHKLNYAYAVFYCHSTYATRTYAVPLVDAMGMKSKAVAICHADTSSWNPKQLAFQVLKVKPGTVPICHFLPNDHIIWVSN